MSDAEIDALVKFMEALAGEGYRDIAGPRSLFLESAQRYLASGRTC